MINKIENVKRPIMYISLSIILASIVYGIYDDNKGLVIVFTSLFFIYFIKEYNAAFTIVLMIFFSMQLALNYIYYNNINEGKITGEVRIIDNNGYCVIGKYKGKQVYLNNIEGDLIKGESILLKGNFKKEVDYERGVVGNIEVDSYVKEENDILAVINKIPSMVFNKLKENVGQRKAALVSSIAFGYKDYLDSEDEVDMRDLGIVHIVSVSGLHVALVFAGCKKIFNDKISILIVIVYVILTGCALSSLRSLIMISILVLSNNCKKNYYSIIAVLISAALNLIFQPYAIFNIGFLLSYLATIGIILFNKKIIGVIRALPQQIGSVISISISAQILTLPILIYFFGNISVTFLLGNLIIVPILNLVIILGNMLIIFCYIDGIFDFISYILLKIIDIVDIIMNKLYSISEGGLVINDKMSIVYLFMLISIYFIYKGYKKFIALPVIAIIVTSIIIYSPIPKIDYIEKGVILISYKGERNIISTKTNVDMKTLKERYLADTGYRLVNKIIIDEKIVVISKGKDFIMNISNKQYYLKFNNYSKIDEDYDIINFIDEEVQGFYIIGKDILPY